jgi:hypothetical protein
MFLQKKKGGGGGGWLGYYTVVKQFKNILVKTRFPWESALVQWRALRIGKAKWKEHHSLNE